MTKAHILKSRLAKNEIVVIPGIYDALSALIAEQSGHEALFLSGSAVSYSQLGQPDVGLVTMSEMADACMRVTDRIDIPVLVDVDSAFGNAAHGARTIRLMEKAGAAAIQMEDQRPINPANDLKGRPLISPQVMADKIKAMVDERQTDILLSARTDSPFSEELDQTLERVELYREAGADVLFAEGLKTEEDVQKVVDVADGVPVLFNLLRGNTELKSAAQLEKLGVSIALFPGDAILSVGRTLQKAMEGLKANSELPKGGYPISGPDFNAMLGTPEMLQRFKDFAS